MYLLGELLNREGFGDEMHAIVENTSVDDGIFGKPSGEEYLKVRLAL